MHATSTGINLEAVFFRGAGGGGGEQNGEANYEAGQSIRRGVERNDGEKKKRKVPINKSRAVDREAERQMELRGKWSGGMSMH